MWRASSTSLLQWPLHAGCLGGWEGNPEDMLLSAETVRDSEYYFPEADCVIRVGGSLFKVSLVPIFDGAVAGC